MSEPRFPHANQQAHPLALRLAKLGISQSEFARRVGSTKDAVSGWLLGKQYYPGKLLASMARAHDKGTLGFHYREFCRDLEEWAESDPDYADVFQYYRELYSIRNEAKRYRRGW